MIDARQKQRMAVEQLVDIVPVEPLAAPIEPLVPEPLDLPMELPQTAVVRRPAVVLVVTSEFGVERRRLIHDRVVPVLVAPLRHRLRTPPKPLTHGPNVNRELPASTARTDVREAEEVEGRRLPRVRLSRQRRAPKRHEPRLLGMQRQPILREPLRKDSQDPFRILAILKAENEVVGVPNFGGLAAQARFYLVPEPLVEHVVQVNIRQQGADDLPLPGPGLRHQEPTIFDNANVNPFPNQPEDTAVPNPSLDERQELVTHNRVEVTLNVCLQDIR